jgi:galactose mutarotase-like enzyme
MTGIELKHHDRAHSIAELIRRLMTDSPTDWIALDSGDLTASIDPLGAQLSLLRDRAGRDLLWDGDPAVWAGRAPLLFPIVGELAQGRYRLDSASYALPRHGFARRRLFRILTAEPARAVLRLEADAGTLDRYPFPFELDVSFALAGATLSITTDVRNTGTSDLPASFGYHPAFRWPLPYGHARAAHAIEFERDEAAPVRRLDSAGLLTPQRHATPTRGRRLALEDALFDADVVIFEALQSRSLRYGAAAGPSLLVRFPDAPLLGLWSKPGAGFLCIEPWHGIADPQGFTGDFRAKPGVFSVAPGASRRIEMSVSLQSV